MLRTQRLCSDSYICVNYLFSSPRKKSPYLIALSLTITFIESHERTKITVFRQEKNFNFFQSSFNPFSEQTSILQKYEITNYSFVLLITRIFDHPSILFFSFSFLSFFLFFFTDIYNLVNERSNLLTFSMLIYITFFSF